MDRPAVLLLERNASVIEVAQRCLPDEVELHVAKTVEMGLRIAARRAPAVVVLDTSMAGASPADTVSRLRAHHPSLRVVFLVEPAVDVDRRYTQLGFVLRKPLTAERLTDAIRTALRLQGMTVGVERMRSSSGSFRAVRMPETPPGGVALSPPTLPPASDPAPASSEPLPDSASGERPRLAGPGEPPRSLTPPPFARVR